MTSRLPLKSHCQRVDIDAGAAEPCQRFLAVVCWQHRADFVLIRQLGQADQSTILRRVPIRRYRRATAVSGHARVLRKRGRPEQKAAGGCPERFKRPTDGPLPSDGSLQESWMSNDSVFIVTLNATTVRHATK
jgi:hypothetical protein